MKNLTLKHYLALVLVFSGIFAICFESLTKGFVTYVPYGGEFVYLREMEGSNEDESVLLWFFGIISIMLGAIMYFVKNVIYVLRIGFFTYVFLFLCALMTDSDPLNQLIMNTVKFDHNIYLILWCLSFAIYTGIFFKLCIQQDALSD
ncbi:hypothetical protein KTJ32_12125 [Acinetobacter gyllenbergii]|uniref:hypothetical protein n=1 Tax=Acinetobacter gyllenbergii TaxID=134534 RepID=UPI0003BE50BA|nr:hypothetical protein [Acinetobacter gyllenbergii]ESK50715.1 hypothetical protein F987_01537 [Acinetobacter gyllenbergii NIPH 230]MCU4581734.1 hypothetical protein [Acinetobacter gyllenbergii]